MAQGQRGPRETVTRADRGGMGVQCEPVNVERVWVWGVCRFPRWQSLEGVACVPPWTWNWLRGRCGAGPGPRELLPAAALRAWLSCRARQRRAGTEISLLWGCSFQVWGSFSAASHRLPQEARGNWEVSTLRPCGWPRSLALGRAAPGARRASLYSALLFFRKET